MYTDKMTVNRHEASTNADGTTKVSLAVLPIYSNLPCRISFGSTSDPLYSQPQDKNVLFKPTAVFCNPSYDIRKGDHISVERFNADGTRMVLYSGIANLPSKYETHQEFDIVEVGVG